MVDDVVDDVVADVVADVVVEGKTSKRRDSVRPDSNTNTRSYEPAGKDPVYSTPSAMRGGVMYVPVRDESETETTRSAVLASTTDSPTDTASGGAGDSMRHGAGAAHAAGAEVEPSGASCAGEV